METVTAAATAASSFDPNAITPFHVVAAIVLNVVVAVSAIRRRRAAARPRGHKNTE